MTDNLIGLVLCGGLSSRMGSDKGLLLKNNNSWAELAYSKLAVFNIPVRVSITEKQEIQYNKIFKDKTLILDQVDIQGPLAGLLSVYKIYPKKDILLLACDMPNISLYTLSVLIEEYNRYKNEYLSFVFGNETQCQPMPGIYSHELLKKIYSSYIRGTLKHHSLRYHIDNSNPYILNIINNSICKEFKNYNHVEDLQELY